LVTDAGAVGCQLPVEGEVARRAGRGISARQTGGRADTAGVARRVQIGAVAAATRAAFGDEPSRARNALTVGGPRASQASRVAARTNGAVPVRAVGALADGPAASERRVAGRAVGGRPHTGFAVGVAVLAFSGGVRESPVGAAAEGAGQDCGQAAAEAAGVGASAAGLAARVAGRADSPIVIVAVARTEAAV
jgi:hypothetical protein